MKNSRLVILSIVLIFASGLLNGELTGDKFDVKKWEESTLKQRAEKDEYFKTSPVSPMAGLLRETAEKKILFTLFLKEMK